MRLIGVRSAAVNGSGGTGGTGDTGDEVWVASTQASDTPTTGPVTLVAPLRDFWNDPRHALAEPDGREVDVQAGDLVPPVLPEARVICIGLNYRDHIAEGSFAGQDQAPYPTLFARWTRSLVVGGVPVPVDENGLDWEGEVAAWVGADLADVDAEQARAAILGYSTFNDLTARIAQKLTSQWILGKNADRSGPLGPLVPAAEVGDLREGLRVRTRVNGETVQDGRTDEMVYTVGDTLSLISHTFTLRPGDLLATGTPSGVGYSRTPPWLLQPGDVVEVEVDRLGVLRTTVVGNEARRER